MSEHERSRAGAPTLSIGTLSRRTGLPVKTIRYYSDLGLLPVAGRSSAGYRRYDEAAAARLALIRTLRELGLGLAPIRRVLDRQAALADVAAAHADALERQIRILRLHRSVLRALAAREPDLTEVERMNDIARASAAERHRIQEEFLDHVFAGLRVNPQFERMMRQARPELPDDPTPEQLDAWIELADLLSDNDFRARIRQMAEQHAADEQLVAGRRDARSSAEVAERVAELAGAALDAGVDPASAAAAPVVTELVGVFAAHDDRTDTPEYREWIRTSIGGGADARAERYWQLLAVINGWPSAPTRVPAWQWFAAALAVHTE
ncbi:MerR family transcriptional regulator [Actinocatenispora thailandica]|uniref:MerR family transcriptional regulator n=1 Tax=Actinocatenispora thailandica TaxID=227318 RepID=A0A7R7HXT2_9ACTN|nr:MerR family transcriptional regulator [Actinocatenispora thailandica]BCJ35961.1 MerR family transcriptional regulator [Actinocatenispora thailandica]